MTSICYGWQAFRKLPYMEVFEHFAIDTARTDIVHGVLATVTNYI